MKNIILAAALVFVSSLAHADDSSCNVHTSNSSNVFNANQIDVSSNPLVEHQILFVKYWRPVVSGAVISSTKPKPLAGLAMFLTGNPSPSSDVEKAIVEFLPTGTQLKRPTYNAVRKQLTFTVNVEHYAAFRDMLRSCAAIYMQYREYQNGHKFADLHMSELPVGN